MTKNKNSVEIKDYRFEGKHNFRRVFIIGAGISADALISTGKGLLREAILTALKENTEEIDFKEMVNNVLKRLKMIYPTFNYSNINTWPTYEEYFDTIYDIIKKKRENNIRIDNFLINEFEKGIDKDAMRILYWYFYIACNRWAEDEIWFIGTTLEYDKYLLNMVKIKKLKDKKIKIKLITPDEEKANNLSKFLGEIYYYKGTMRQYKEDLTKLNSNKEEWDKRLDDDKFIKKGG